MEANADFQQKLKQRLVYESINVKYHFKFISALLTEGVLSDGSSYPDKDFVFKDVMVKLAMNIAFSKGPHAIGGLMKAMEASGNSQFISVLRTWAKEEFSIENNGDLSELIGAFSAVQIKN